MTLNGKQIAQIQEALLAAYSRSSLTEMVAVEMGEDLDEIAGNGDRRSVVLNLIHWANRRNRLAELLHGAHHANPGNLQLLTAYNDYLSWQSADEAGAADAPQSSAALARTPVPHHRALLYAFVAALFSIAVLGIGLLANQFYVSQRSAPVSAENLIASGATAALATVTAEMSATLSAATYTAVVATASAQAVEVATATAMAAKADADQDGLSAGAEIALGLDPFSSDTDGDGLDDGLELAVGCDPLEYDTDGDLLSDYEEFAQYGTSPLLQDTDGNGITDTYEGQIIEIPTPVTGENSLVDDRKPIRPTAELTLSFLIVPSTPETEAECILRVSGRVLVVDCAEFDVPLATVVNQEPVAILNSPYAANPIVVVPPGSRLVALGRSAAGDWVQVAFGSGTPGWIARQHLSLNRDIADLPIHNPPIHDLPRD